METFRGVVYPWHCDHQGQMATTHYGDLTATSEKISVFFDTEARGELPLSEEFRARLAANIVTRDD